ncbi:RICH domain-containing protein [Lactococcus lactis]|uniref:RICH domain-containing protein n=1 Tax=Lactococcus lactis TaxID=1358 RepID=UPI00117B65FD|nr:RICH domain-containing protein [Lactococcus lactis]TRW67979.1 hypothetical protein FNJ58_11670 [Lactococcus lactis]
MRSELVGKPKLLSKRELELQEVKYIYSLRAERDELQEQINTAKKALTEIQQLKRRDTTNLGMINKLQTIANEALEAIGGDK